MGKRPSIGERISEMVWSLIVAMVALAIAAILLQRYWPWVGGVLAIGLVFAGIGGLVYVWLRRW